ncbi:hypothetical protein CRUP_030030 [Coryphaenoides rupestris]|nr:hypothetical protein CRUP_030030 [Coryphaenoides rupestris]
MAVVTVTLLLLLTVLSSLLCPSPAQDIIGSSVSPSVSASPSAVPLDHPGSDPSPLPGGQTVRTSLRSDVPVKARTGVISTTTKRPPTVVREGSTNELSEGQRLPDPTIQSDAVSISTLSTQNLSSGPVRSQPTGSRPRTDAASIALSGTYATAEAYTKGSDPPVIPPPSNEVIDSFAGLPRVTAGRPGTARGPQQADNNDWQEAGSGSSPTRPGEPRSPVAATLGNEMMAQFRAETQTTVVGGPSPENADVKPLPAVLPVANQTEEPRRLPLTTTASTSTTASPEIRVTSAATAKQTSPQTVTLPAFNGPPTDATTGATKGSGTVGPAGTAVFKQPVATGTPATTHHSPTTPAPEAVTRERTTAFTSTATTTTPVQETTQVSSKTTGPPATTATTQSESTHTALATVNTETTSTTSTTVGPVGRGRSFDPLYQPGIGQRNRSVSPEHRHRAPTAPPANPTHLPASSPSPNGTRLQWDDLRRTLAFAWHLHVYGSASLFLILFAGAALGLTLSPSADCPQRGALALANTLLFLVGGIRAAFFLLDPYGTRHFLPRTAVIALYNLPLHMLCTLLLAADLLSPALSPVVPVTLQVLSLCWGLIVCLGFLCYVFPRVRCPTPPNLGVPRKLEGPAGLEAGEHR